MKRFMFSATLPVAALAVALVCGAAGPVRAQVVDSSGLMWSAPFGEPFTWGVPPMEFSWEQAVAAANGYSLGEFDDWRLPTVYELINACHDGTLPGWLEANGWILFGWDGEYGGGFFWSSEQLGTKPKERPYAWSVLIAPYGGSVWDVGYWWRWDLYLLQKDNPGSMFFVRGRPPGDPYQPPASAKPPKAK